ncbi:hypothetical protein [Gordonia aichiensis]|uniref:hypothetical protein n=1 Tax=Gordonia aichiensis TaxID=36820 RepID=UPI0032670709
MKPIIAFLEKPMRAVGVLIRLVVAAVLFVVALGYCIGGVDARTAADRAQQVRATLQESAGGIVADVFSVDSRTWSSDRRTAQSLVAPPLSVSSQRGLTGPPPAGIASVSWVPQHVAVSWADDRAGEALIIVRVTVTARGGHTESRLKSVQAAYVRSGDRWLLNGLEELQ